MRSLHVTRLVALLGLPACLDPLHGRVWHGADAKVGVVLPPERECGRQEAEIAGDVDVSVLLVLDRSRSMARGTKWAETRAAIDAAVGAYDRYLRFGLLLYPSAEDACAEVARELAVPVALDNAAAVSQALADAAILRGTPTGAALRAARDVMADDPAGHRAVILATDGLPDCTAEGWDDGSGLAAVEAYDATDALAESGVPVYVVGIEGSGDARPVLERIADIGQTARAGASSFYETTGGDALARALVDIALDVEGCTIALDPHEDAARFSVALDGAPLPAGGYVVDGDRLRVGEDACLTRPGESHTVEVVWYCRDGGTGPVGP